MFFRVATVENTVSVTSSGKEKVKDCRTPQTRSQGLEVKLNGLLYALVIQ